MSTASLPLFRQTSSSLIRNLHEMYKFLLTETVKFSWIRIQDVGGLTLFSPPGSVRANIALIAAQYADKKINISADLPTSKFIVNKVNPSHETRS